ncbi:MAG: T9SS type A sorting domain-containing protein [Candidatus Marinimicrobia bacterium]|nr:T9SS type A sorting domain-containing protein [Candidatus Neomarinimicrobiota bacterium]
MGLEFVGTNENPFTYPDKFSLKQNYPNPFNPTTTIQFILPKAGNVNISIFDLSGHEIIHLVRKYQTSGSKSVIWDGTNKSGKKVPSGVYFYSISTGNIRQTRKMVLLK